MIRIRQIAAVTVFVAFILGAQACFADSAIPDMVGTWTVKTEGGVLVKGGVVRPQTHHAGPFSTLTAEAVVTKQKGRVLHGIFTSPRATENFIAVIGMDNKTFWYADEDGIIEGRFVTEDRIDIVYRHITPSDTVIGVGTWTRKK